MFVDIFTKEGIICHFLFPSLENETLQKYDLLLKERICSLRSKFFPSRADPNSGRRVGVCVCVWGGGGNMKMASPERVCVQSL